MNAAIEKGPLVRAFFHLRDALRSLSGAPPEQIRSGGIVLPTGRDSPSPRARPCYRAQPSSVGCARFTSRFRTAGMEPASARRVDRSQFRNPLKQPRKLRRGTAMARKNGTVSDDITEIEREIGKLMQDLETRVSQLNTLTRKGASNAASEADDYVSETLSDTAERLRNGANVVTDEAARLGQRRVASGRGRGRPAPFADAGGRRWHRLPGGHSGAPPLKGGGDGHPRHRSAVCSRHRHACAP